MRKLVCDRSRCCRPARLFKAAVPVGFNVPPSPESPLCQAAGGGSVHVFAQLCDRHADRVRKFTRVVLRQLLCLVLFLFLPACVFDYGELRGGPGDAGGDLGGGELKADAGTDTVPGADAGADAKPPDAFVCVSGAACNPFAPDGGCGAGKGCYATPYLTCQIAGTKDIGELCTAQDECRPSLGCIGGATPGLSGCRPYCCRSTGACPASTTCHPVNWGGGADDANIGACW